MSLPPTVDSPRSSSGRIVSEKNVSWVWSSGSDFVDAQKGDEKELWNPAETDTTQQSNDDSSSSMDLSFRSIVNDDETANSEAMQRARRRVEKSTSLSSPISRQQKRITANKLIINKSFSNLKISENRVK